MINEESSLILSCYSAILNRWLPPKWLKMSADAHTLTPAFQPSGKRTAGDGGGGGLLLLHNDVSHMIVLFISHWRELGHEATSSCKGGWKMNYLFWAAINPANFFLRQKERRFQGGN